MPSTTPSLLLAPPGKGRPAAANPTPPGAVIKVAGALLLEAGEQAAVVQAQVPAQLAAAARHQLNALPPLLAALGSDSSDSSSDAARAQARSSMLDTAHALRSTAVALTRLCTGSSAAAQGQVPLERSSARLAGAAALAAALRATAATAARGALASAQAGVPAV